MYKCVQIFNLDYTVCLDVENQGMLIHVYGFLCIVFCCRFFTLLLLIGLFLVQNPVLCVKVVHNVKTSFLRWILKVHKHTLFSVYLYVYNETYTVPWTFTYFSALIDYVFSK